MRAPTPVPGEHFGPLLVEQQLGHGGVGRTYRATFTEGPHAGKAVCLKVPAENQWGAIPDVADDTFEREARVVAGLNHDNIAQLLDTGQVGGTPYLAFELVDGADLGTILRGHEKLSLEQTLQLGLQIARGLAFAHGRNVLHRDLKPENVMISASPEGPGVKIVDFGLAKERIDDDATEYTQHVGTPRYWSREQMLGQPLNKSADVYSCGVILFRALTGHHPFLAERNDSQSILRRNVLENLRQHTLPQHGITNPDVVALVECCLHPDSTRRFADATAVLNALVSIIEQLSQHSIGEVRDLAALSANHRDNDPFEYDSETDTGSEEPARAVLGTERGNEEPTVLPDRKATRAANTQELVALATKAAAEGGVAPNEQDAVMHDLSRLARDVMEDETVVRPTRSERSDAQRSRPPSTADELASRQRRTVRGFSEHRQADQSEPEADTLARAGVWGLSQTPDEAVDEPSARTQADSSTAEVSRPAAIADATATDISDYTPPRHRWPVVVAITLALIAAAGGMWALRDAPATQVLTQPVADGSEPAQPSREPSSEAATTAAETEPRPAPSDALAVPPPAPSGAAPQREEASDGNPSAPKTAAPASEDGTRGRDKATAKRKTKRSSRAGTTADVPSGPVVPITIGVIPAGTVRVAGKGTVGPAPATVKLVVGSRVRVTATYKGRRKSTILVVPPYPDDLVIDLR